MGLFSCLGHVRPGAPLAGERAAGQAEDPRRTPGGARPPWCRLGAPRLVRSVRPRVTSRAHRTSRGRSPGVTGGLLTLGAPVAVPQREGEPKHADSSKESPEEDQSSCAVCVVAHVSLRVSSISIPVTTAAVARWTACAPTRPAVLSVWALSSRRRSPYARHRLQRSNRPGRGPP